VIRGMFVTGTDTDAGKTVVAAGLVKALGGRAMGLKPVASGSTCRDSQWMNEDAAALLAVSPGLTYREVNRYSLEPAIAPHLAAQAAGVDLHVAELARHVNQAVERHARFAVVEGAGGWRVPLGEKEYFSDLASALQLPVLLVVRIRLGCINHALLTAEAVERDGLRLTGWVANGFEPGSALDQAVMQSITDRMAAPCVGRIPRLDEPSASRVAQCFDSRWLSALSC
jgi:dethiobiotin synthetase